MPSAIWTDSLFPPPLGLDSPLGLEKESWELSLQRAGSSLVPAAGARQSAQALLGSVPRRKANSLKPGCMYPQQELHLKIGHLPVPARRLRPRQEGMVHKDVPNCDISL